ncbi:TIGR03571 family LLM class oxidoreductase [Microbulbifer sp. S227A]|uniref:TIGR03571 family LLM class oxidoreductase n=1 Tax=Microbulbifer sp. S227A TaxID=3415131 RepID=UPI003C7D3AF8
MFEQNVTGGFRRINRAYNAVFKPDRLSIGLVVPLESYPQSAVPAMARHLELARMADELGFAALWLRDVPFNVPSFGDAGQVYDPFVYLGTLAATTRNIALGVASIVLPLRHPAHVAKAAASADALSGGRLLLGVASGDRPEEYPALNMTFPDRGDRFRDSVDYIRAMAGERPEFQNARGRVGNGMDMLPKPVGGQIPLLITGGSRQTPDWVARNGDGWMTYPRDAAAQGRVVSEYRQRVAAAGQGDKPVMQSLYVDLVADAAAAPRPIHLGFQSGTDFLRGYLNDIVTLGVNHVALNLRFNGADMETTLNRLARDVLPDHH